MVMPASEAATASMVSSIPVIVMGGVTMRFADEIFPSERRVIRKPRKRKTTSRLYGGGVGLGDFSNVGF